jgi:hypothetical protein
MKLFPQINKDQVKLELFSFASNFDDLHAEAIIDRFAQSSSELIRLLTCP